MPEITVAGNFSRVAMNYDTNARVQAQAACDLLSLSLCDNPRMILEPGCGTGLYTRMLLESFPEATVRAIDISDAMVRIAEERIKSSRASFFCADAEALTVGRYDLITSNASFHWFRDLERTIENLCGMLDDRGALTFSYFGPNTYHELQKSIESATGSSMRLACNSFLPASEIRALLSRIFRMCEVDEQEYCESFASLRDLLNNIKLTGTRGVTSNQGIFWTRGLMKRLEETYLDRFGSLNATYQVYMVRCRN